MQHFIHLVQDLDQTTSTNDKVEAMKNYLQVETNEDDKIWMVALLCDKKPARGVSSTLMREWVGELTALPDWLIEDAYHSVGDMAETLSLLLPKVIRPNDITLTMLIEKVAEFKKMELAQKKTAVLELWESLDNSQLFIFNKLITGGFRLGVSKLLLAKALGQYLDKEEKEIIHRLMGDWTPGNISFHSLLLSSNTNDALSKPYPFLLAYGLDGRQDEIADVTKWAIEYKWDGIRTQIIKRQGTLHIWSRGEELITDKFPELHALQYCSEDNFVIDGEILAYKDRPLDFSLLQTRIGRKNVGATAMKNCPIAFYAYDLLEYNGQDYRAKTYAERRADLDKLVDDINLPNLIKLSTFQLCATWEEIEEMRAKSADYFAEGIMLKDIHSSYEQGRKTGLWWKWKVDPYTVDAVMIYAQKGHGRRANLFTDYTFAIWTESSEGQKSLVPFTKAYSGLTDAEFEEVTTFVKKNTITKFGPVYSVKPELVFELAFEGIAKSTRHKSGIALRFPRIKAWRRDKKMEEADSLATLMGLLESKEA
jgi:DNA ligase 1